MLTRTDESQDYYPSVRKIIPRDIDNSLVIFPKQNTTNPQTVCIFGMHSTFVNVTGIAIHQICQSMEPTITLIPTDLH